MAANGSEEAESGRGLAFGWGKRHGQGVSVTGYVALLMGGMTAAAMSGLLPLLTAGLPERDRRCRTMPALVVSFIAVVIAARQIQAIELDSSQIFAGVACSFALVVGILAEWVRETLWGDRLDANALCAGLLAAGISAVWCGGGLGERIEAWTLVKWTIWGAAWQGACGWWLGAFHRPLLPRRRDPPDLGVGGCHTNLWRKYPRA